ncbi:MAG: TetR/AcrR family transcriptional regulator [Candidatus Geothermincolia bacterium]
MEKGTRVPDELAARRREEILATALKLFGEKGYHNTSIADIAAELGLGHGTFYRYFKNKYDIFSSVVAEIIQAITQVVVNEDPTGANSLEEYREQLERIGGGLFGIFSETPYANKIVFYDALGIDESMSRRIQNALELFGLYTEMYLKNGIAKGFLRPDLNTRRAALAINGMIFAAARDAADADAVSDEQAVWVDTIIGLMLFGMRAG